MIPYITFPDPSTHIFSESARYKKSILIEPHAHTFLELVLITGGACSHQFRQVEMPLFSGDIFLIPAHQPHSYRMHAETGFINCYFYPEASPTQGTLIRDLLRDWSFFSQNSSAREDQLELLSNLSEGDAVADTSLSSDSKAQIQGITHLNATESHYIESLLLRIQEEQEQKDFAADSMKFCLLLAILITIQRAQQRIHPSLLTSDSNHRAMIEKALAYMDQHFTEEINIGQLARDSAISENYFRSLFKNITGLTPLDYITRLRVAKSLEYIQREGISICQAAEKVGIYDPNYFTRVFKKIMGNTPKYFKKIQ